MWESVDRNVDGESGSKVLLEESDWTTVLGFQRLSNMSVLGWTDYT